MPNAPSSQVRTSAGNRTLLVLIDSSQVDALHLPESLYSALGHWGMPYEILDLASAPLRPEVLRPHAAVVIAQEHLGYSLGANGVAALLAVVQEGLGLVNLDHDLFGYGTAYQEALRLAGLGPGGKLGVEGAEQVVFPDNSHYITWTREIGEAVKLRQAPQSIQARCTDPDTKVLAEAADGWPLLVARQLGQGKIVQWLISPKVWTHPFLGHARGLDDLYWKGIAWAARKPFVMNAMLPFFRFRFDDCFGWWRDASDLYFVDVLNEAGHKPSLALCLRAVTPDGAARMKALYDAGKAEFPAHTIKPNTSIFYGDEEGEYTEQQLRDLIAEVKGYYQGWALKPSPGLSDHEHSWSWRVVPLLSELGIQFKSNITMPGEVWGGVHVDWRPAPYGLMDYALDYLPDRLGNLFVVHNHYKWFENARTYLPDGRRFTYNRDGGFGSYKWDFLSGLTTFQGQQSANQLDAMARRLADHTRLGVDSLFFGGSITHSHFIRELSAGEWRALLEKFERLTNRYNLVYTGYDDVSHYARSRFDSHLAEVQVESDGTLRVKLEGRTSVPLKLSVFSDVQDGTEHRYQEVPVFDGSQEVTAAAAVPA